MNANGVLGSLNFPSMARFCGQFFASRAQQDPDLALAVLQAYNDWHIDAWCGAYPERFIPCTIPPIWDPALMAAEVHRTAAKGSHCVSFSMNPHALGLPSLHGDHWDPFWAACDETDTVVTLHIGSGGLEVTTSPDAPMNVRITCSGINIYPTAADLVWSPIFQKFKNVKVALAEGGVGWIPYFLERIDYTYEHHKAWTEPNLGGKLPSEIFRERIITCFIVDKFGLGSLGAMNEDMVAWECDYPHSDTTWPRSPEVVWDSVQGLTDEQIDKITHANAMRLFSFDPFATRPRELCTVGALRKEAEGRDVSNVSHGVEGATHHHARRIRRQRPSAERLRVSSARGVRVLEVASHVFVPMSGAVLSEWGADVIKIEHPETGDPYRGLVTAGLHKLHGGIDPQFQSTNRGKRSVGVDLKHPEGRRILGRLLESTDVFVTNLRADTRRTLSIDVDDVRADNPSLIYVRGTAFGSRGPDANRGGYDAGAYWARTGMQHVFTQPGAEWPVARDRLSVTWSAG